MLLRYGEFEPTVEDPVFLAPGSHLIGHVHLEAEASVWFNAVLRGDEDEIRVGFRTNLQDGVVVHTDPGMPCDIGRDVTVGHNAVVHGCRIGDTVLVGMGAIVLTGAVVGEGSILAAGTLVTSRAVIPPRSMVMGAPGRVVRTVTDSEFDFIRWSAEHYRMLWKNGAWV
jgi:carbonic anhydrase/acetyltransferase-like protein (isoleucine patch superfamily)